MGKEKPAVSVIVVNWNGAAVLQGCLDSLARQSCRDFEVIVVDNGSRDSSLKTARRAREAWKREENPPLHLVELERNRGYCGGNNVGIARARGEFIALLNNDAEAEADWLAVLLDAARRNPRCGQFASKILLTGSERKGAELIDNTGHLLYPDGLNRGRGRLEEDRGQFDEAGEALCPSGAAAFYRRRALEEAREPSAAGPFDEDFFCYGDDFELGLRLRRVGWPCLYVPGAVVRHRHSHSLAEYSPKKVYLIERNRLWVLAKHFPLREAALSPFYTLLRYGWNIYGLAAGRGAARRYVEGRGGKELALVLLRADLDALRGLPRMLKKRLLFAPRVRGSGPDFRAWAGRWRIGVRRITLVD